MIKITSQEESEQEGRLLFVRVRGLNFETSPQKKKKKNIIVKLLNPMTFLDFERNKGFSNFKMMFFFFFFFIM